MQERSKKDILVAVDLFSGGGGLSAGLKQAGFVVTAAVEYDKYAVETYTENHPETILFAKNIRDVSSSEILSTSPTNKIDLIAACPPCQSFSSLTSKYKKKDPRDELIFEFCRIVKEIKPQTIMMENVPGLAIKGARVFDPAIEELRSIGYNINYNVLEVADYGVPQRRKRLVLLGKLHGEIQIPKATHSENGCEKTARWLTVREAISKVPSPILLSEAKKKGGPQKFHWNVIRNLSETNIQRLKTLKEGGSRTEIPLKLRPTCHLDDHGFTNVYGRMAWDRPSPTITGGCTTLSKGRFGHPTDTRTISVREAAALQSFPADYKFKTDFIDRACTIIGNALPPKFAEIMAKACIETIRNPQNESKTNE